MKAQQEKQGTTHAAVQAMLGARPENLSGGQIENFKAGWALNIMGSRQVALF